MVKIILTEEEKASLSIFEWDDASIGKMVKALVPQIWKKGVKDYQASGFMAAAVVLITLAHDSNAETTTFQIEGVTSHGNPIGDYEIKITRTDGGE